ncbi:4-phosphopantetheinyl transferase family protein [Geodermatophilus normandii]|uniref:4-phosphopantetheinyl transferase family protein n=1 Tax=Geodermatophilus normandii TaxID=1137989 RepID=A0A6P0GJP3_9ACTN|nr:4'-phosphopantetheinyl transferase superfamily protein [Geodermatophilus normandii]NEM07456.1 4-phosphopantetheinyl transferase family protein [Geodermatophilus normandii]
MSRRTSERLVGHPAPTPVITLRALDLTHPGWDLARAAADLAEGERARADRGVASVRRRRLLVRSGLRRVLGRLLDVAPNDVPLVTVDGRPTLPGSGLGLSCSASEGVAVVAVAAGATVGVDVQRHRDEEAADAAAEGWLGPAERARLAVLPPGPDRLRAVTRCWTQKEAVLKAQGTGLRHPLHGVVTPVAATGRVGPWRLVPVAVPEGYVASLACDAPLGAGDLAVAPLTPGGSR